MPGRRTLSLVGVAVVMAAGLKAGTTMMAQTPAQAPPSVTFQVEVNYVDVDTVVTDEQGNFVPGLTREDFEVFEDGKPQKIEMFSYVELPVERAERFAILGRPVSTDIRSNARPFDGRVYVIVMDDLDISPLRGGLVKRAARDFVDRHFGANDLAAVVYTSGRTDATQDFTSDRGLLIAAIDKFVGRKFQSAAVEALERHYQRQLSKGLGDNDAELAPDPGAAIVDAAAPIDVRDLERDQRAHAVLDTLKNLGDFLAGVRGRRKAVLLFSEGVEMPIREIYGVRTATDVVGAIKDAITAAARSNVNFFTLDPRGLIGMTTEFIELAGSGAPEVATGAFGSLNAQQGLITDIRVSQDTLRTLAEETGGFAAVNTNDLNSAFARIVDANSRYYVLGYYPPTQARDGRFHRIEVRVRRPGLRVSARRGYAAPRGRTAAERKRDEDTRRAREARRGAVNNTSQELRDALNSPLQQSGLAFSVQAAPFKLNQNEAAVALAIELDGDDLQFAPKDGLFANNIELSFFGINQDGRAQRTTRTELNLTLRPESLQRVTSGGLRINPRMTLEPGRYQLRVGIRDSNARVGTVFYDLVVPDFRKEQLMLSGLLVTSSSAQAAMTAMPDKTAPPLLPGPAMSRRTFSRNDTVTVFAEIYDNVSRQQRREIDAAVSLISETGQHVFTARDVIANDPANRWTSYGFAREIPLKSIPAGRYLLKVEAALRDLRPSTRSGRPEPVEGRQGQAQSSSATASAGVRETVVTIQ
jgi:VWFA-related protein